jgi:hypothetical protein
VGVHDPADEAVTVRGFRAVVVADSSVKDDGLRSAILAGIGARFRVLALANSSTTEKKVCFS